MALGSWSPELPISDHTGLSDLLAECPVRRKDFPMEGTSHAIRETSHLNGRELRAGGSLWVRANREIRMSSDAQVASSALVCGF